MNDRHDKNQSSQLDEILRELEARFTNTPTDSKHSEKKSRKSFFSSLTQTQIIGSLTLVLLLVGAASGIFLGRENQELRRRAQSPYPECNFNPTCSNPDCNGDITCVKGLCFAAVGGVPPFSVCMFNGQEITFDYCAGLSCTPSVQKCSSSPPTASACYGNDVGSRCTGFNGTCRKTTDASNGTANCGCVADGGDATDTPTPTTVSTNPTDTPGGGGNPSPTQIVSVPTNTPRPTNTSVPVQTNTPVPGLTGGATFTPVPAFTNTPVPLEALTATPTLSDVLPPVLTATPNPASSSNNNVANTNTPQPNNQSNQTQITSNQNPNLPQAGNPNKSVQVVLAAISLAVLVGAVALLFFL